MWRYLLAAVLVSTASLPAAGSAEEQPADRRELGGHQFALAPVSWTPSERRFRCLTCPPETGRISMCVLSGW